MSFWNMNAVFELRGMSMRLFINQASHFVQTILLKPLQSSVLSSRVSCPDSSTPKLRSVSHFFYFVLSVKLPQLRHQ